MIKDPVGPGYRDAERDDDEFADAPVLTITYLGEP